MKPSAKKRQLEQKGCSATSLSKGLCQIESILLNIASDTWVCGMDFWPDQTICQWLTQTQILLAKPIMNGLQGSISVLLETIFNGRKAPIFSRKCSPHKFRMCHVYLLPCLQSNTKRSLACCVPQQSLALAAACLLPMVVEMLAFSYLHWAFL